MPLLVFKCMCMCAKGSFCSRVCSSVGMDLSDHIVSCKCATVWRNWTLGVNIFSYALFFHKNLQGRTCADMKVSLCTWFCKSEVCSGGNAAVSLISFLSLGPFSQLVYSVKCSPWSGGLGRALQGWWWRTSFQSGLHALSKQIHLGEGKFWILVFCFVFIRS